MLDTFVIVDDSQKAPPEYLTPALLVTVTVGSPKFPLIYCDTVYVPANAVTQVKQDRIIDIINTFKSLLHFNSANSFPF